VIGIVYLGILVFKKFFMPVMEDEDSEPTLSNITEQLISTSK
jgi:hypothetical protein